jgi:hypothetical protein
MPTMPALAHCLPKVRPHCALLSASGRRPLLSTRGAIKLGSRGCDTPLRPTTYPWTRPPASCLHEWPRKSSRPPRCEPCSRPAYPNPNKKIRTPPQGEEHESSEG